jgi:hypothetical protein
MASSLFLMSDVFKETVIITVVVINMTIVATQVKNQFTRRKSNVTTAIKRLKDPI